MNGKDFIKALAEGKTLVDTHKRVYIKYFKQNKSYSIYTLDFSLFCYGDVLTVKGEDEVYLEKDGRSIAILETEKFEVF